MIILALNTGSSSVKCALFETAGSELHELFRTQVEGGADAADRVLAALKEARLPRPEIVGHRFVHGGPAHHAPARIDAAFRRELEALTFFAPLHLPAALALVDGVRARFGNLLQIACFDTAFHRDLPEVARRFPMPRALYDAGVRRYGFHGLSYEHVMWKLGGQPLGRAVLAHLGSGASLAAVRDGQVVDTTMGLTPAGGIMMGTRCGDIDPGVLVHLLDHAGYDARQLEDLVNHRSGLLAVSETTSDMQALLEASASDPRARLAVEMFCGSVRKAIGALTAVLGGVDTLVFTGGIGEHAPEVRARICAGLSHLGLAPGGRCRVLVVPADEERTIARHAAQWRRTWQENNPNEKALSAPDSP